MTLPTFTDFQQHTILIASSITALGTIGLCIKGFYRYVLQPTGMTFSQMRTSYKTMEALLPILVKIAEEFKPNHGSSLRDSIDRIENCMENLRATDHLLLNLSDVAHFETDERGDCVWVNTQYCSLTGLPIDEALGRGWVAAIHPEDREMVITEWENAIMDKRQFTSVFRYMRDDGSIVRVRCHAIMNLNGKNKLVGSLGSIFPLPMS